VKTASDAALDRDSRSRNSLLNQAPLLEASGSIIPAGTRTAALSPEQHFAGRFSSASPIIGPPTRTRAYYVLDSWMAGGNRERVGRGTARQPREVVSRHTAKKAAAMNPVLRSRYARMRSSHRISGALLDHRILPAKLRAPDPRVEYIHPRNGVQSPCSVRSPGNSVAFSAEPAVGVPAMDESAAAPFARGLERQAARALDATLVSASLARRSTGPTSSWGCRALALSYRAESRPLCGTVARVQ
jgi:hypothetical protein